MIVDKVYTTQVPPHTRADDLCQLPHVVTDDPGGPHGVQVLVGVEGGHTGDLAPPVCC